MRYTSKILDPTTCGVSLETLQLTELACVKIDTPFRPRDHHSFVKLMKNFKIGAHRHLGSHLTRPELKRKKDQTRKVIFGLTLTSPDEHVGVMVDTKFNLHNGFGVYYGYATCCILDFIVTRQSSPILLAKRKREKREWDPGNTIKHWVCPTCLLRRTPDDVFQHVEKNRLCSIPYPQSIPKHQALCDVAMLLAKGYLS